MTASSTGSPERRGRGRPKGTGEYPRKGVWVRRLRARVIENAPRQGWHLDDLSARDMSFLVGVRPRTYFHLNRQWGITTDLIRGGELSTSSY
jgi:hypothetical protein